MSDSIIKSKVHATTHLSNTIKDLFGPIRHQADPVVIRTRTEDGGVQRNVFVIYAHLEVVNGNEVRIRNPKSFRSPIDVLPLGTKMPLMRGGLLSGARDNRRHPLAQWQVELLPLYRAVFDPEVEGGPLDMMYVPIHLFRDSQPIPTTLCDTPRDKCIFVVLKVCTAPHTGAASIVLGVDDTIAAQKGNDDKIGGCVASAVREARNLMNSKRIPQYAKMSQKCPKNYVNDRMLPYTLQVAEAMFLAHQKIVESGEEPRLFVLLVSEANAYQALLLSILLTILDNAYFKVPHRVSTRLDDAMIRVGARWNFMDDLLHTSEHCIFDAKDVAPSIEILIRSMHELKGLTSDDYHVTGQRQTKYSDMDQIQSHCICNLSEEQKHLQKLFYAPPMRPTLTIHSIPRFTNIKCEQLRKVKHNPAFALPLLVKYHHKRKGMELDPKLIIDEDPVEEEEEEEEEPNPCCITDVSPNEVVEYILTSDEEETDESPLKKPRLSSVAEGLVAFASQPRREWNTESDEDDKEEETDDSLIRPSQYRNCSQASLPDPCWSQMSQGEDLTALEAC